MSVLEVSFKQVTYSSSVMFTAEAKMNATKEVIRDTLEEAARLIVKGLMENGCFLHHESLGVCNDDYRTTLSLRVLKPIRELP